MGGLALAAAPAVLKAQGSLPARIKVALIGCGGRGTGAASQALHADDYSILTAVADVFDALTHKRVYKDAWSEPEALRYLQERAGDDFDPAVVAALAQLLDLRARMTVIRWHPDMSVGHPDLDHDHRTLLDLVNHLADADSRDDPLTVEGVLDELTDYTFMHFEREGKRPDGTRLDTTRMPVRFTKNLSDTEVQALYAFLKTVPPKPFGGR
mgnify:CR=1 FL=1